MSIIKLFKKIINKKEKKIDQIQTINFEDINNWYDTEIQKIKTSENTILKQIENRTNIFIVEIKNNIAELEEINIDLKDANERVKKIVKQNFKQYIEHAKKLLENINTIEYTNFEKTISQLNSFFIGFEKKSILNYQKTSFIINKDLQLIRKNIIEFSKDIKNIFEENKNIIKKYKEINNIDLKVKEILKLKEKIIKFNKNLDTLNQELKDTERIKEDYLKEIEENKKNKEYIENIKKIEELKKLKQIVKDNLYKLKQIIDFKELGNIYHSNINKMEILKLYRERFQDTYLKNSGEDLLNLLENTKINNPKIIEDIKEINEYLKKIRNIKETIKEDKNEKLKFEIEKTNNKINEIKSEIDIENQKIKKAIDYKKDLIIHLKNDFEKRNIILKD
jgi:hypothetical protein